jgi:hypothetical protein
MNRKAKHATFPCPCCGHLVFDGPPGTLEICRVCFWVDDPAALRYATTAVDPRGVSLVEAQKTYAKVGACEERWVKSVSRPRPIFAKDEDWRPFDPQRDVTDNSYDDDGPTEWPEDLQTLYYWRDRFWMRSHERT